MEVYDKSSSEVGNLAPGFRFHPTDEELITFYLLRKVLDSSFNGGWAIAHVDLNKSEPWDLPGKAKIGEKQWYFFSLRDRKYPTGLRTNRATDAGYWKATGKDREIYNSSKTSLVGMKKTLVFYRGRAPKGQKTNWVMHEYRLHGKLAYQYLSSNSKEEWVISRVFQKNEVGVAMATTSKKRLTSTINYQLYHEGVNSPVSPSVSLPPLLDSTTNTSSFDRGKTTNKEHVSCFSTFTHVPTPSSNMINSLFNYLPIPSSPLPPPPLPPPLQPSGATAFVEPSARSNFGASTLFPSLKSLQENLQLPLSYFSAAANGVSDQQMGDFGLYGSIIGNWSPSENQRVTSSELDRMWRY